MNATGTYPPGVVVGGTERYIHTQIRDSNNLEQVVALLARAYASQPTWPTGVAGGAAGGRRGHNQRVAQTIYDVLDDLRVTATSEADKGSKLERLFKAYLLADPLYADQFSDVWLWNEWPGREGKHDTGIDLVAKDALTDGLVAIQCKFFAPTSTINKPDIDSFLSASGKEGFTQRVIVSTTDKWNGHAEDAIKNQAIPVRRIGLSELEDSPVNWSQFSLDTPEVLITVGKKKVRPHQASAIADCRAGFVAQDRGKLIMACGTGKTFTALRLAENMVGAGGSVLFPRGHAGRSNGVPASRRGSSAPHARRSGRRRVPRRVGRAARP